MKTRTIARLSFPFASTIFALCAAPVVQAADGSYTSQAGAWNLTGSWQDGIIADGADFTAFFTNDVTSSNRTTSLGANRTIGNIVFTDADNTTGFNRTISGSILTLDVTTGAPTINVTQGGSGTTRTLTISSVVAGDDGLTKIGAGTLALTGNNTYTGVTTISGGTLSINSFTNGGGGGSLGLASSASSNLVMTAGTLSYSGATTTTDRGLTLKGNSIITVSTGASNLNIAGTIVTDINPVDFTKGGGGTLTLSGVNTYNGRTFVSGGTLVVNSIKNFDENCSLGKSTTAAGTLLSIGTGSNTTTFSYIGTGNETNRPINLPGTTGGGVIDHSGTGLLKFTGNMTATGAGSKTLTLQGSTSGTGEYAGAIADNSVTNTTSLSKTGSGTWTLSGTNTYTGATTVSQGSLIINGAVASTSVVVNGSLGGSGVMANATVSGSGSINPGNSPGIFTAAATDPSGGLDYNFEFTAADTQPTWNAPSASVNDVLRLTGGTPFTTALGGSNTVTIYLNVASLTEGNVFTGGFYTDANTAFLSSISGGTFQYYLANAVGSTGYGGNLYDLYTGPLTFEIATVAQTADFGAGPVNGFTTRFTVIPEPGAALLAGLGVLTLLRRRR